MEELTLTVADMVLSIMSEGTILVSCSQTVADNTPSVVQLCELVSCLWYSYVVMDRKTFKGWNFPSKKMCIVFAEY